MRGRDRPKRYDPGMLSNVLASDPTAETAAHLPDDRFIPLPAGEMAKAISADMQRFGPQAAAMAPVFRALWNVAVDSAAKAESELLDLYAPFNPDRDTLLVGDLAGRRTAEEYARVQAKLAELLEQANFEHLEPVDLERLLATARKHGMRVRVYPERIDSVGVWVRGRATADRCIKTWRRPLKGECVPVPIYRRLAIVARLKGDPHITLKLFKDIPATDVEALLPHAEARMTWFDQCAMVGGSAGALGATATKLYQVILGVAYWSSLLWVGLVGAVLLSVRAILGYRRARLKRDWQRTQQLYYQNLDNNAGVIHALMAMIVQEQAKESMLAYALSRSAARIAAGNPPWAEAELRRQVEAYLQEVFHVRVDFDVADAVRRVRTLGLWNDAENLVACEPDEAVARLGGHGTAAAAVGAPPTV